MSINCFRLVIVYEEASRVKRVHFHPWEINRIFHAYDVLSERTANTCAFIFKAYLDQVLAHKQFCIVRFFVTAFSFAAECYSNWELAPSSSKNLL